MTRQQQKRGYSALLAITIAALTVSLVAWSTQFPGKRYVFLFPSLDTGTLIAESRFLPAAPVQGQEALFVDELLLGPMTERCQPLFSPGTHRITAFERAGVLYVDISAEALAERSGVMSVSEGASLFSRNILNNFSGIKSVVLFIDGTEAFADR
ncbi:MAG: GerMN domain-containing protein [Treponema sp.]|nr:GerMN domain-containing protein [Treponema sp.]